MMLKVVMWVRGVSRGGEKVCETGRRELPRSIKEYQRPKEYRLRSSMCVRVYGLTVCAGAARGKKSEISRPDSQ